MFHIVDDGLFYFFYRVDKGQLFATKYKLILPSAQELQDEISRQTALLRLQL
jgi:hypothetical protein